MKKVIIAGVIGNGLEWYDYALYAYMTLIISKLFFPAGNESVHLLATLGIFAVGFVARPFGGVFFGWLGDKFGRKTSLIISIFMMAIPTGCIGLLPTYEMVGMVAPILLIILRILQGLSLGGAFSGSITFLVEHAPYNKRGLIGSATISSLCVGFLLGSIVAILVKLPLTDMQYESWGWRIPFLLGIPIGFIGLYIRDHCEESPVYETAKKDGHLSKSPLGDVFTQERRHVAQAMGVFLTATMPFYLITYFITYSQNTLVFGKTEAMTINMINMLIMFAVSPFSAMLSDRIGRRKVLGACALLILVCVVPIFTMLQPGATLVSAGLAQAAFTFIVSLYVGPVPALLVEIFPTRVRYTGMAISYNICAAVFGGTMPMVAQWLMDNTHNSYTIAAYVCACCITSLLALYFYKDRHEEALA
jgi:MHS family proline/betaine transporter-like MFS transporter